jgi:ATP-dependent helicase HrpA
LPISARKDEIVETIRKHQVTIVTGETGSGKTTQLPKMCIEAGRGRTGLIGCTQPRRVAAVTVAQRLAEEMGEEVGRFVSYKIRFDEKAGPRPLVKVMTDGVLLVEAQSDRLLRRYDTLIVDEAHERSLNIDFVLGILRSLLPRRPDLKVIVTSATLDTEKFARAFQGAPVIEVSGRMYPVEVRWRPPDPEAEEGSEDAYVEAAVAAMEEIRQERLPGDTLIFMPTEQDIWETCELLAGRWGDETVVLPLFARLPIGDQRRVFQPASRPKIIVATNVAETSLTIPNIRYVIDTGLARIAQYNPRSRTAGLPVRPISQSSAEQRKGRCGRVREGVCIRLYSQEDFQARPLYTPPEILRSNLAGVILQMLYLRLGDIAQFPFIDQPAKKNIADALEILVELGAVRKAGKDDERTPTHPYHLTELGRVMARLPLDPRIARMMIEGRQRGCLRETAVIAAALSVSDPRERPPDRKAQADSAHAVYRDDTSDFNTLLRLWTAYTDTEKAQPSQNRMRKYCQGQYLSYKRMREWRDVHRQILQIMAEETTDTGAAEVLTPVEDMNAALHKTILSGYLGHIAQKKEKNLYWGAKGREALIFPGSALWGRGGEWIVAAEWVETSRLYARIAARVEPEWIEEMGRDLCRRTYSNPRWEKNREDVVADEQVTLSVSSSVPGVRFPSAGSMPTKLLLSSSARDSSRRPETAPALSTSQPRPCGKTSGNGEQAPSPQPAGRGGPVPLLCQRLPGVASGTALRKRLQQSGGDRFLYMDEADMLQAPPDAETLAAYPDEAIVDGLALPLTYRFEPGSLQDGVTLTVPAGVLPGLDPKALDWLVPGLLPEKIQGLLKGLPKEYRRKLPPSRH